MKNGRFWLLLLLAVAVVLLAGDVLWACPTCKDSLAESDPGRANMVRGYFWSILFMMSMPFLIIGGLGTYFYIEIQRARKRGWTGSMDSIVPAGATGQPGSL